MERPPQRLAPLPAVIFSSRWLQLPLYLGLIVAQAVYVSEKQMPWQVVIHPAFVASAIAIALVDRLMEGPPSPRAGHATHTDDYEKTA